jgi:trimeric autotransporter adhesin
MSTITLRNTKGSPLTNTEVDNNFSNLNTDKLESTYSGAMNSLTGGTSIATVGTITAGTWSATAIGATRGGTGQTTYAAGDLLYASATNTLSKLTKPATASYLKMAADGTPSWDTLGLDDITTVGTITVGTWNAGVIGPLYGGTGVANNASATVTSVGNFAYTRTLTGATNVTFPTTGTLATLAGSESLTNKKLGSLTSNGLVTTSGGDGTLSVTTTLGVGTGGTGTTTAFTAGSVVFAGASGVYTQDNSNLFFDDTNNSLGIGTATPNTIGRLAIIGGTTQIGFGDTNSTSTNLGTLVYAGTSGLLTLNANSTSGSTSVVISTSNSGTNTEKIRVLGTGAVSFGSGGTSTGTSGQVLTSAGSGASPTWQTNNAATTGKAIAMAMVFGG